LEIGHDCWIGRDACILDGIKVGNGAIIAARALVTSDVPPYAIVAGVPARVLRYRFDEKLIDRLECSRWWDQTEILLMSLDFSEPEKALSQLEAIKTGDSAELQTLYVTRKSVTISLGKAGIQS